MRYQRQINFTLHDYKTRRGDRKLMSRFLDIHQKLGSEYYIDTIEFLVEMYEASQNSETSKGVTLKELLLEAMETQKKTLEF